MHRLSQLADYWSLTKPEVNLLIGITTVAGFWLDRSSQGVEVAWAPLAHAVAGTLLIASGTGTLNQWLEWRFDARMRRTAMRPVAAGRIAPSHAFLFGLLLSAAGAVYFRSGAHQAVAPSPLPRVVSGRSVSPVC